MTKGFLGSPKFPKSILFITCLWLIILFLFNPHFIYTTSIVEEWFASKGLIFYKDFVMFHAPLSRIIFLPIHLIFKWNFELDPFVGLFLGLGNLLLLYRFGKSFLSIKATAITLLFFSVIFWYTATGILYFHEILIAYLLTWIIFLNFQIYTTKKVTHFRIFILGVLITSSGLTGQVSAFTIFITIIFSLFTIWKRLPKSTLLNVSKIFILGIFIPLALISSYFIINNAFFEFFQNNIIHYFFQYNGYDRNLLGLPIKQLLIFYSPLLVLLTFATSNFFQKKAVTWQHLYLLLLSASSIPSIVLSVYHPHHLNYALPILALSAGLSYEYLNSHKTSFSNTIFFAGVIVFLFVTATEIIPWHFARIVFPPNFKIANDLYPNDYNSLSEVVSWLKSNTKQQEKLIVIGTPLVYLKSDRLSSINLAFGLPQTWMPLSEAQKQIQSSPPNYWVIDQVFIRRLNRDYKKPEITQLIEAELSKCYKMEYSNVDWEVWKWEKNNSCTKP